MKLEDIKIGMKVRLLGKHGHYDNYDNIEDWYKNRKHLEDIQRIKESGYGVVKRILDDGEIYIREENNSSFGWYFIASDLEPYEEITKQNINESVMQKTPKQWLLTPKAIFVARNSDEEYIVLGNNSAIGVDSGRIWDDDLENDYTDDLKWYGNLLDNDIMKITYEGNVVWERKECMTLTDAIKTSKKLKVKDWDNFIYPTNVMLILSDKEDELINLFTDKVWEVE